MKTELSPTQVLTTEAVEANDHFTALSLKPVAERELSSIASAGAVTAKLHSFDASNQPLLCDLPDLPGRIVLGRTTISLRLDQIGATVLVVFIRGDVQQPVVIGILTDQAPAMEKTVSVLAEDARIVLTSDREIVLRCGEASITLTKAGKVLIQGAYVSTRAAGVNRIRGGSVLIN